MNPYLMNPNNAAEQARWWKLPSWLRQGGQGRYFEFGGNAWGVNPPPAETGGQGGGLNPHRNTFRNTFNRGHRVPGQPPQQTRGWAPPNARASAAGGGRPGMPMPGAPTSTPPAAPASLLPSQPTPPLTIQPANISSWQPPGGLNTNRAAAAAGGIRGRNVSAPERIGLDAPPEELAAFDPRNFGRFDLSESVRNLAEMLGLGRLATAGDPGVQFSGRELADEIFTPDQINQMAQQRAEPAIRAAQDALRYANEMGATGGYANPNRSRAARSKVLAETALARQSATRDAQLDAAAANAQQAIAARDNSRQNALTDLQMRLGLGQLGLSQAGQYLQYGLSRAGLDQNRDLARLDAGVTQRGQDISGALQARGQNLEQRGQNLNYTLAGYQGDLAQRGQDIGLAEGNANRGLQASIARSAAEQNLLSTQLEELLGLGRLGLEGRGQDINAALTQRQQDIGLGTTTRAQNLDYALGSGRLNLDQQLGLGRLGLEAESVRGGLAEQRAAREQQLQIVERQLAEARLTQDQRNALDAQRIALERELTQLQLQQSASQFDRRLDEDSRQFDAGLSNSAEQASLGRQLAERSQLRAQQFESEQRLYRQMEQLLGPLLQMLLGNGGGPQLPQAPTGPAVPALPFF